MTPEEKFGTAVRQAREARGWSQEDLASELALAGLRVGGQSGITRIERAERPTRLNEVIQIAQLLGLNLSDIVPAEAQPSQVEQLLVSIRDLLGELVAPVRAEQAFKRRLFIEGTGRAPGESR